VVEMHVKAVVVLVVLVVVVVVERLVVELRVTLRVALKINATKEHKILKLIVVLLIMRMNFYLLEQFLLVQA